MKNLNDKINHSQQIQRFNSSTIQKLSDFNTEESSGLKDFKSDLITDYPLVMGIC